MFVCSDCYAVCEGQEKHPESPACDEFDGKEDEVEPVESDSIQEQIDGLQDTVTGMYYMISELERKFNTIIAAVVKASGPEEER